jgi:hypothetical protein
MSVTLTLPPDLRTKLLNQNLHSEWHYFCVETVRHFSRRLDPMKHFATVIGMSLVLTIDAVPALAGRVIVPVPEPATMGMFAAGAVGVYVLRKFIGRK